MRVDEHRLTPSLHIPSLSCSRQQRIDRATSLLLQAIAETFPCKRQAPTTACQKPVIWICSIATGAPPITCRSVRSICSTIPLLREPLRPEHIKPRLLGHWGTTPGLISSTPISIALIRAHDLERDLRLRARPWRAGYGRQHLSRRHLQRDLSRYRPRCRGLAQTVPPVLLSRRHSQPRGAGNAGLDPRGRRTRLRAAARLWRRASTIPI